MRNTTTPAGGPVVGRVVRKAALAAIAALLGLTLGCGGDRTSRTVTLGTDDGPDGGQAGRSGRQVLLEAGGTGVADIAYAVGAEQAQESEVPLPWRKELGPEGATGPLSIMVVSRQQSRITCRITVAGKVVDEATNDGTGTEDGSGTIVGCRSD